MHFQNPAEQCKVARGSLFLKLNHALRSTDSQTRVVTRTHSTFGLRAFAAAGPGLWNSLAPHLRDADLPYSRLRRLL